MIVFEKVETAEQIVDLNCHQQMYSYEQQFSISCMGIVSPRCLYEECKGYTIILHIERKRVPKRSPKCGHAHFMKKVFSRVTL